MELPKIKNLLKEKGLKITPARVEILHLFLLEKKPLDMEMVAGKISEKINSATIYRNLIVFEKRGIIKKVHIGKGSAYYEFPHSHHHHIVCKDCGTIEDFDFCEIDRISKKAIQSSKRFAHISDHSLELFGLCKKCD